MKNSGEKPPSSCQRCAPHGEAGAGGERDLPRPGGRLGHRPARVPRPRDPGEVHNPAARVDKRPGPHGYQAHPRVPSAAVLLRAADRFAEPRLHDRVGVQQQHDVACRSLGALVRGRGEAAVAVVPDHGASAPARRPPRRCRRRKRCRRRSPRRPATARQQRGQRAARTPRASRTSRPRRKDASLALTEGRSDGRAVARTRSRRLPRAQGSGVSTASSAATSTRRRALDPAPLAEHPRQAAKRRPPSAEGAPKTPLAGVLKREAAAFSSRIPGSRRTSAAPG